MSMLILLMSPAVLSAQTATPSLPVKFVNFDDIIFSRNVPQPFTQKKGVGIVRVFAEPKTDLQEYDVIYAAEDKKINDASDFAAWMKTTKIGTTYALKIARPKISKNGKASWKKKRVRVVPVFSNDVVVPFDFRKVRWGMTRGEVKKAEDLPLLKDEEAGLVYRHKIDGVSCKLAYYIRKNGLDTAIYRFTNAQEEHVMKLIARKTIDFALEYGIEATQRSKVGGTHDTTFWNLPRMTVAITTYADKEDERVGGEVLFRTDIIYASCRYREGICPK